MKFFGAASTRGGGRLPVIAGSVTVGTLIVVAAAAGAAAYVGGRDDSDGGAPRQSLAADQFTESDTDGAGSPDSTESSPPAPPPPPPLLIPGADLQGFVTSPARCADLDRARMIVLTDRSQAVVCERAGAMYYAGWRFATGQGTRIDGVQPAGAGWVAWAPDATINVNPEGLVISTPAGEFVEAATGFWAA